MNFEELTEQILSAAYTVYNKMGSGFIESVYERCLLIELNKLGIKARSQRPIDVYYDNQVVGEFVADLVIEERIIVEVMAEGEILPNHEIRLVNSLTATQKEVGLLINFNSTTVEIKEKRRLLATKKSGTKPLNKRVKQK